MLLSIRAFAIILSVGIASPVMAQDRIGGGERSWAGGHAFDRSHKGRKPVGVMDLSIRLAAAEIAIGIEPEQEAAWSEFASAMIDYSMAARSERKSNGPKKPAEAKPAAPSIAPSSIPGGPIGSKAEETPRPAEGETLLDLREVRMLDRVLQADQRKAEAATRLKAAVEALSVSFTSRQVEVAKELLSETRGKRHRMKRD